MKVKELRDKLSALDPNLDVLCYTEDDALLTPGHLFRLFEIERVDKVHAELKRADDGIPSLKIGEGPASTDLVVLEVIADF